MKVKLLYKITNVHELNQMANEMKRLNQMDKLKTLAKDYQVPELELKEFFVGKRYFLIDAGDTRKTYDTARAKIMDEMLSLNDPMFTNAIGEFLLATCSETELEAGILLKHKTLQRCISYLMKRAYDIVDDVHKKPGTPIGIACQSDTVFQWVRDYYALDDQKELEQEKEKAEEAFKKKITGKKEQTRPKTQRKKVTKNEETKKEASSQMKTVREASGSRKNQLEGQCSLFDLAQQEECE